MMERSKIKMIRAGKDDKSILRRIDPDTCRALCDSLEEALDELDRLRAAPPPSPDIAGLVERALSYVNDADQLEHCDPKYLCDDLEEFATALQRVAQERDAANREATRLLVSFVHEHCDPVPDWAPLPDLMGVLTQISNAVTVTRDIQAKLAAAEARIATARDEGLEDAALLIDSVQIPSAPLAAERFAAAIRALKGQLT